MKSQKNGNGSRAPHSSPMNIKRRRGREQHDGERGFERRRLRQHGQPLAQRAVADLVVVLQEIDEGGGGQAEVGSPRVSPLRCGDGSP